MQAPKRLPDQAGVGGRPERRQRCAQVCAISGGCHPGIEDGHHAAVVGAAQQPPGALGQQQRGVAGGITASAHLDTGAFVQLAALLRGSGDLVEARALWRRLMPITQAAFAEPNPAVIKGALARQGWMVDALRPPMQSAAPTSVDRLLAAAERA